MDTFPIKLTRNYRFIRYWLWSRKNQFEPRHSYHTTHTSDNNDYTHDTRDNCNRLLCACVVSVCTRNGIIDHVERRRREKQQPTIDAGCRAHRIRVGRFHWCYIPGESHIAIVCVCVYVCSLAISTYETTSDVIVSRRVTLSRSLSALLLCWAHRRQRVNETREIQTNELTQWKSNIYPSFMWLMTLVYAVCGARRCVCALSFDAWQHCVHHLFFFSFFRLKSVEIKNKMSVDLMICEPESK